MATDLPPVPPAVVKYAQQKGHTHDKVVPEDNWKSYKVYYLEPDVPDNGTIYYIGLPVFLLYDGKTVRYADDDERDEILRAERLKRKDIDQNKLIEEFLKKRKQK